MTIEDNTSPFSRQHFAGLLRSFILHKECRDFYHGKCTALIFSASALDDPAFKIKNITSDETRPGQVRLVRHCAYQSPLTTVTPSSL